MWEPGLPARLALAARLSEEPGCSVLLLEAGPDYPDFELLPDELKYGFAAAPTPPAVRTPAGHPTWLTTDPHNWQFSATATDLAPPMLVPRGRVTGGSSAINSSAFYRGVPEDFDAWAARGNDQWSYEKVLPFFRKSETDVDRHGDYHGSDGPIFVHHSNPEGWSTAQRAFFAACRANGFDEAHDHNHPDSNGIGPAVTNNHNGVRFSTAPGIPGAGPPPAQPDGAAPIARCAGLFLKGQGRSACWWRAAETPSPWKPSRSSSALAPSVRPTCCCCPA